jgi:hypothetical protein
MNSKTNYDSILNGTVSLSFSGDEVDEDKLPCVPFVAINYPPQFGGIGMYIHSLSFHFFANVMH